MIFWLWYLLPKWYWPAARESRKMAPANSGCPGEKMEMFIFARFHARPGQETGVEAALRKVIAPTRQEPGCVSIHAFRSIRDGRLFYIHSHWADEAAFDHHAGLPHTMQFVAEVQPLMDHELETFRTKLID